MSLYSTKTYPPKPPDTQIPIIGKMPTAPHETLGRLAFSTDEGWSFLRKSLVYNAQAQGADLVVLKNVTSKRQLLLMQAPPQWNYYPVQNYYRGKKTARFVPRRPGFPPSSPAIPSPTWMKSPRLTPSWSS